MKNSQYLNEYLNHNNKRGYGNGLTVGSFLSYRLKGKSKKYSARYYNALMDSLKRVKAVSGPSIRGSVAYYINNSTPSN